MMDKLYIIITKENNKIINFIIYQNEDRAKRQYLKYSIEKIKKLLDENETDDEIYTELNIQSFKAKQYSSDRIYDIYYFIDNIFKDNQKFLDDLYEKADDFDKELPIDLFS